MKNLLVFLVIVVAGARGSLRIENTCGEVECPRHTFCSPIDHLCRPCHLTCDRNGSNYDHERCVAACQDYLHDTIYTRKNETVNMLDYVRREDLDSVKHLLAIVAVTTSLTLLVILLTLSYFLFKYLHRRFKQKRKQKTIALPIIYDNKYGKEKVESFENSNNNKMRSITLEREPSESTLPEYAYDNPNMSSSPVHHV